MVKKFTASYNNSMIYIIKGEEKHLIKNKLEEFSKRNTSLVKIDGQSNDFSIDGLINACKQVDLFSDFNTVLVKDAPFLIEKYDETKVSKMMEYINNPLYECDLVFYTLDNLYNEKLKAFKDIAANSQVLRYEHYKKRGDFTNICKRLLNEANLKLNYECFNYLVENCFPDLDLFNRNLELIKLYPDTLDIFSLKSLVSVKEEQDVFKLINAITSKNVSLSINLVNKYLKYDDNVLGLISLLASQLRLLYSISYYQSIGKSKKDIEELLNINPYRLQKAYESISNFDMKEICLLLNKLSDLDYNIKVDSSIDEKLRIELFFLELL